MNDVLLVIGFSLAWAGFGLASGWVGNALPDRWLQRDVGPLRLRAFEDRGRWYDRRLKLRTWKDRLPEAGAFFAGGTSKRHVGSFDPSGLAVFAVATRRAELVHWANIAFGWTFALWTEAVVAVVMIVFGIVVHLPFVAIQRYNRARIDGLLRDRAARRARSAATGSAAVDPGSDDATHPESWSRAGSAA